MYNSNHISMGFGVCKCKTCRHIFKGRDGKWTKHRRNPYRAQVYRAIIKKMRQAKFLEDLPRGTFSTGSYTD